MFDVEKCKRCMKKAASWYNVPWSEVCSMSKEPSHRSAFDEAETNLCLRESGEEPVFKTPMEVKAFKRTGFKVEAIYSFPSLNQFILKFSYRPKVLGMKPETLTSEDGFSEIEGVLLKFDPTMTTWRRVYYFSETIWMICESIVTPEGRLRESEPVAGYRATGKERAKQHPAARHKTRPTLRHITIS